MRDQIRLADGTVVVSPLMTMQLSGMQIGKTPGYLERPLVLREDERLLCAITSFIPSHLHPYPFLNRKAPLSREEACDWLWNSPGLKVRTSLRHAAYRRARLVYCVVKDFRDFQATKSGHHYLREVKDATKHVAADVCSKHSMAFGLPRQNDFRL